MESIENIKEHNSLRESKMIVQFASMEGIDLLKGKPAQIGEERQRGDQIWRKEVDGWVYVRQASKGGAGVSPEEAAAEQENKLDLSPKKKKEMIRIVAFNGSMYEKVKAFYEIGVKDPGKIAQLTNSPRSQVLTFMLENEMDVEIQGFDVSQFKPALPPVDVRKRWQGYRLFLDMVATGVNKACIAYGTGGVGKTYNAMQVLDGRGLQEFQEGDVPGLEGYDYIKITGKVTPMKMYAMMYEHNGKIMVFDDCDSVLEDDTSVNILKGALDTSGDGTINYGSGKKIKGSDGEEIPQRFAFKGQVIFISNLDTNDMPQPLISRSTTIDLSMTPAETMTMLKDISPHMNFRDARGNAMNVPDDSRDAAVAFMDKYKDRVNPDLLNTRTLQKIAITHKTMKDNGQENGWEDMAMILITHNKE